MSYADTKIVIYGVKINSDIAKKIYESELNEDGELSCNDPEFMFHRKEEDQLFPITPYEQHDDGYDSTVFNVDLWSEGTDSRIHNNKYQPKRQHYLGIYIASSGYAYTDNIKYFLKSTPLEALRNFEMLVEPLLKKYEIKEDPEVYTVNQVW